MKLTAVVAGRLMRIALGHVGREYPHRPGHVLTGASDARSSRDRHPLFFGSFDWHGCVHGWWTLLTLARLYPNLPEAALVRDLAMASLTPAKVAAEVAGLARPDTADLEPSYGWAWLLTLHAEALRHRQPWARALDPLAAVVARRFRAWLPRATYPVRAGTHGNTAFALIHAHAWAQVHDPAFALALIARARFWYGSDRDAQAWEPDGDAFLSPLLTEAHCMRRLLPRDEFEPWLAVLLPRLAAGEPVTLFEPAFVSDRSDARIARLDGLNLSRAWNWRALGVGLPLGHIVHGTAERHLAAGMPHIAGSETGEHWLASFALLALLPDSP